MALLSQRLAILQRTNQAIQPYTLPQMGRPEIQELLLALEEMKMLMSELEILRLLEGELHRLRKSGSVLECDARLSSVWTIQPRYLLSQFSRVRLQGFRVPVNLAAVASNSSDSRRSRSE